MNPIKNMIEIGEIVRDKLVLLALPDASAITPDQLRKFGALDVLVLEKNEPESPNHRENCVRKKFTKIADVRTNNAQVAILYGRAALATLDKRKFARLEHILIPTGISAAAASFGILRYAKRKLIHQIGTTCHEGVKYLVLKTNVTLRDNRRQYGPSRATPLELLQKLRGIDYVTLRWSEIIESGEHDGDIDLLITHDGLKDLQNIFKREICTYPLDIYTDDGQEGYAYKNVPYFTLPLAHGLLKSASETHAGIRVASPYWRFLAFCYHLTFHNKTERVTPGTETINQNTFHKPHYYPELQRLANLAGEKAPETYSEMEAVLKKAEVFPSLDMIGFYSNKNQFLKQRYFASRSAKPGLITFFVRDFGLDIDTVSILRTRLTNEFEIIAEGAVDSANRSKIMASVRGGNWFDKEAKDGTAEPLYWFVCIDHSPVKPSARTQRKHPRVDNEKIRIKDDLRKELGNNNKALRVIHSSDNSLEALEHLEALGILHSSAIQNKIRGFII